MPRCFDALGSSRERRAGRADLRCPECEARWLPAEEAPEFAQSVRVVSGARGRPGSELLDSADLIGRVIRGVIAARMLPQRVEGGPELDPYADSTPSYVDSGLVNWHLMHVWLQFEGLGPVYFKLTTEEIELVLEEPDLSSEAFFLSSEGFWVPATRVGAFHAPAPLAALIGATVTEVMPLYSAYPPQPRRWSRRATEVDDYVETGLILETTKGAVAIADVGDEYAVGEWPDKERWEALGVVTELASRRVPRA
jgi:hypothetical protein